MQPLLLTLLMQQLLLHVEALVRNTINSPPAPSLIMDLNKPESGRLLQKHFLTKDGTHPRLPVDVLPALAASGGLWEESDGDKACVDRWGAGTIPAIQNSKQELPGGPLGTFIDYYSMQRSGAKFAAGYVGMTVFHSRSSGANAVKVLQHRPRPMHVTVVAEKAPRSLHQSSASHRSLHRAKHVKDAPLLASTSLRQTQAVTIKRAEARTLDDMRPEALRTQTAAALDQIVARWASRSKECVNPQETGQPKTTLFLMAGTMDLDACNPWHRLAAIYPAWVSRQVLGLSSDEVDLFMPGWEDSSGCAKPQDGLLAVSSQEVITKEPENLCAYSHMAVPMSDGFLWDLAWDQHFQCGPTALPRAFAKDLMVGVGLPRVEPHPHSDSVRFCIASRLHAKHRVLENEDEVARIATSCKLGPIKTKVSVFSFTKETPFQNQVEKVRQCDVLFGMHGAGLVHAFWMSPGSVVVEVLPSHSNVPSDYAYYRNLAKLMGSSYLADTSEVTSGAFDSPLKLHANRKQVREAVEAAVFVAGSKGDRRMIGPPTCQGS